MVNVLFVIRMCVRAPSSRFAMSAILARSKADALSVEVKEFQMRITAKSAPKWKKIETAAQKLLI